MDYLAFLDLIIEILETITDFIGLAKKFLSQKSADYSNLRNSFKVFKPYFLEKNYKSTFITDILLH